MAVHFIINGPGTIDGAMLHRADDRDIQIGVLHEPRDGYKMGFDGQIIKETLGVREFMERLGVDRHRDPSRDPSKGLYRPPHEKLDHDTRQILIIVSTRNQLEIQNLAETLDRTYSDLIKNGRIVLAEHKHSMRHKAAAITTESVGSTERSVTQSELWDVKKVNVEMDRQGYNITDHVSDDEVYYSMTP